MEIPRNLIDIRIFTAKNCSDLARELIKSGNRRKLITFYVSFLTEMNIEIVKSECQKMRYTLCEYRPSNNTRLLVPIRTKLLFEKEINLRNDELWQSIQFFKALATLYAVDFSTIEIS